MVVEPETDDPAHRFRPGAELSTRDGRTLTVRSRRDRSGPLLVRFEGVDDRDAAEALRGTDLLIDPGERRELGEDEFWPDELVGLAVRDRGGALLGRVADVLEGAAQARLLVETTEGVVVEVPFVAELVPEVDPSGGTVVVDPIPGLMDPRSVEPGSAPRG